MFQTNHSFSNTTATKKSKKGSDTFKKTDVQFSKNMQCPLASSPLWMILKLTLWQFYKSFWKNWKPQKFAPKLGYIFCSLIYLPSSNKHQFILSEHCDVNTYWLRRIVLGGSQGSNSMRIISMLLNWMIYHSKFLNQCTK